MAISPGGRPADASPVGTPGGKQNWVDKTGGLPTYVREVAHALMRKGMPADRAIPAAVNRIKRWAAGADNVRPQVQAAAAAALAEWEAKKAASHSLSAHADAAELLDLAAPADLVADLEASYQLDLAARDNLAAELAVRDLDLAELAELQAVIDLAPGDYSPPYDWKHGYIPITPAAALSKAGKGPHAGKGRTRTPKGKRITAGSVKKVAAKQAAAKGADTTPNTGSARGAKPPFGQVADMPGVSGEARRNLKQLEDGNFSTSNPGDRHGGLVALRMASYQVHDPADKAKIQAHIDRLEGKSPNGGPSAGSGKPSVGPSDAEKIRNAETMHGTGSPQHVAALKRFGAPSQRKAADDHQRGRGIPGAVNASPGPSNAEKIANAEKMYGTGSPQHLAAVRKFGAQEQGRAAQRRAITGGKDDGAAGRAMPLRAMLRNDDAAGKTPAKAAPAKKADAPTSDVPAATSGGIDQVTARRMSDAQLERAMERLMASGTYDGPAFGVIEKELNRRDDAKKAAGKGPRR